MSSLNNTASDFARFLRLFTLVLAAGVMAVVAFVLVVDPYGIYRLMEPASFNAVKPGLSRYQSEIKQVHAERVKPDFVILGNSRAEIGFDPKAPAFQAAGGRGYNLAVPGTGISLSSRQLQQLEAAGIKPKTVILGVEFLDFLSNAGAAPAAAAAAPAPHAVPGRLAYWQFDSLFSLASVKDAISTLRIQRNPEATTIADDGFNPLKEYRAHVRNDGYHKIFEQRAQEYARQFKRKSTTALSPQGQALLRQFLQRAAAGKADVKLVIYPYHAQVLAMFEAAGLWPLFDEWKRDLVAAVAQTKRLHPDASIAVLDFSGYGPYNCERIPAAGEANAQTKWYWEAGHFKKELGDIVMARTMAPAAAQEVPFGVLLDTSNAQANAERIATERRACAAAYPAMFNRARQLLGKTPDA